ncbi:Flagellin protein FlaA [Rhodovulum sp. P5]|uniref:flagellin N-terminal helical domain-containing protein n=1 Tax=Rhodovulum sp. P5 TaxID=1564506 RepID=UPI0009C23F74|nr:flagellin [Rhodovulum sp. P5]ARE40392.1 Flagellin protein FlaA [Rhodovulum sp. P5]
MSSILTNSSAMVALKTLRSINSGLNSTQSEISTGKSISSAKDNSAVWAISKVMESDVTGFDAVATSLQTGGAMVSVARTAVESITEDLQAIKEKIIAGQDPSADTGKLDNEITELVSMIESKISGAQFNGVNLLSSGGTESILGSIDRSGTAVTTNTITVNHQNMSTAAAAAAAGNLAAGTNATLLDVAGNSDVAAAVIAGGGSEGFALTGMVAGNTITMAIDDRSFSYTVTTADTASGSDVNEIAIANLYSQVMNSGMSGITAVYDPASAAADLTIQAAAGLDRSLSVAITDDGSGALGGLSGFSTSGTVAQVEAFINGAIDAAAALGASESRIESQTEFVKNLSDSLKTGIGALVDADMEEASAKLQALQVQQQLATQSLSIANQGPQNLLSLFR